jgi:hypothetical protein
MSTICHHTMSLNGFIAGPEDSMEAFGYGETTSLRDSAHRDRVEALRVGDRDRGPRDLVAGLDGHRPDRDASSGQLP